MAAPPPASVPATTATPAPSRKQRKAARGESSTGTVCEYILAILLPPIAVFLAYGCKADFIINVCLTILGWIPGSLHALWCIARKDPASKID